MKSLHKIIGQPLGTYKGKDEERFIIRTFYGDFCKVMTVKFDSGDIVLNNVIVFDKKEYTEYCTE